MLEPWRRGGCERAGAACRASPRGGGGRDQGTGLRAYLGHHVDHAVLVADLHRHREVLRRLGREVDVGRLLAEGRRALRLGARLHLDDVELRGGGAAPWSACAKPRALHQEARAVLRCSGESRAASPRQKARRAPRPCGEPAQRQVTCARKAAEGGAAGGRAGSHLGASGRLGREGEERRRRRRALEGEAGEGSGVALDGLAHILLLGVELHGADDAVGAGLPRNTERRRVRSGVQRRRLSARTCAERARRRRGAETRARGVLR